MDDLDWKPMPLYRETAQAFHNDEYVWCSYCSEQVPEFIFFYDQCSSRNVELCLSCAKDIAKQIQALVDE